jgi:hypothetical protein
MVEAWEASVLQHFELQGNKGLRPISARQLESLPDEYELPTF